LRGRAPRGPSFNPIIATCCRHPHLPLAANSTPLRHINGFCAKKVARDQLLIV
jgi:hypothetical protein